MEAFYQDQSSVCNRCGVAFTGEDEIVAHREKYYHGKCFVCVQCFRAISPSEFYEFEGRRYCKYDYQLLFAVTCSKCGNFILDKVIKAIGQRWHPECLRCESCNVELVQLGIQKFMNKPYCRVCYTKAQHGSAPGPKCPTCQSSIEPKERLTVKGNFYHAHHFTCCLCLGELTGDATERQGSLYCLNCYKTKLGLAICAACRRPIEGRVTWALGKSWHTEHFVCHRCETAFMGSRYHEWYGQAYCLQHYQEIAGSLCHICGQSTIDIVARFANKSYCPRHFTCFMCDQKLHEKSKIYEIDLKPACKVCYEALPREWIRRLAKLHVNEPKISKR